MMMRFTIWLYALNLALIGCQTRNQRLLNEQDFPQRTDEEDELPWDELGRAVPASEPLDRTLEKAPKALRNDRTLYALARAYRIERPKLLGAGVVGRRGDAVLYATTWSRLQESEDRAYWDLVRVLSQRYGCLMRQRRKHVDGYTFICRDKRQVTLRYRRDGDEYLIIGRQKDRYGRNLFVQNK